MPLSPERLNEIVADLANRPSGVVPGRHEHVRVTEAAPFTRARRAVREALIASGTSAEIDRLVAILLDGPPIRDE